MCVCVFEKREYTHVQAHTGVGEIVAVVPIQLLTKMECLHIFLT